MKSVVEILFWFSIGLILYTYLIYPFVLYGIKFLGLIKSQGTPPLKTWPNVTMVITAYNEEKVMAEKLQNCLILEYPQDKLEILIGSDGSTDRTDEICDTYMADNQHIKRIRLNRSGKSSVLNQLVPVASGEIIVFSDANSIYQTGAIKHLVKHFSNEKTGCVSGELKLHEPNPNRCDNEVRYWNYEVMIKKLESDFGIVVGASGGIYAIRKSLFELLPANTLVDDFLIAMRIALMGFNCIHEPEAVAFENTAKSIKAEFQRRVRIGTGNFQNLIQLKRVFRLRNGKLAFAYLSHKVIRWFVPFLLVLILICNAALLEQKIFQFGFSMQLLFYYTAFLGFLLDEWGVPFKVLKIPYSFISMNLAILTGFFKFCRGVSTAVWRRTDR